MIVEACISAGATNGTTIQSPVPLSVAELLGQAKVDSVHYITLSAAVHEEIVWFDIPMQKAFAVNVLDPRDGLVGHGEDGPQRKLSATVLVPRPTSIQVPWRWGAARVVERSSSDGPRRALNGHTKTKQLTPATP